METSISAPNGSDQDTTPHTSRTAEQALVERLAGSVVVCIVVLALIVNSLFIAAFIRDARLQVVFNFYVFHLAASDIMFCPIVLVTIFNDWFRTFSLENSSMLCLALTVGSTSLPLQQLTLMHMMTRDRYKAVRRGLTYRHHRKVPEFLPSRASSVRVPSNMLSPASSTGQFLGTATSGTTTGSSYSGSVLSRASCTGGGGSGGSAHHPRRVSISGRSSATATNINLAREKVKVFLSWVIMIVVGFVITDISQYSKRSEDNRRCKFHDRFLYVHYTAEVHGILIGTLLVSFLMIYREYWKQKSKRLRLRTSDRLSSSLIPWCPCLGRRSTTHCPGRSSYLDQPRVSTAQLVPRSPVESSPMHGSFVCRDWYDFMSEDFESGLTTETSIDTAKSQPYSSTLRRSKTESGHGSAYNMFLSADRGAGGGSMSRSPRASLGNSNRNRLVRKDWDSAMSPLQEVREDGSAAKSRREAPVRVDTASGLSEGLTVDDVLVDIDDDSDMREIRILTRKDGDEIKQDTGRDLGLELTVDGLEAQVMPKATGMRDSNSYRSARGLSAVSAATAEAGKIHIAEREIQQEKKTLPQLEKTDLHKSVRIFSSIDKYCLEPVKLSEKGNTPEKNREKERAFKRAEDHLDSGNVVRQSDGNTGLVSDGGYLPALPAMSFSDDELTEIPDAKFEKLRTDSLYTLRSCLSIPEESSTNLTEVGGHREDVITENDVEGCPHTTPGHPTENKLRGAVTECEDGGIRRRKTTGDDGIKSALFTIGDGAEEEDEESGLEESWEGWDKLFGVTGSRDDFTNMSSVQRRGIISRQLENHSGALHNDVLKRSSSPLDNFRPAAAHHWKSVATEKLDPDRSLTRYLASAPEDSKKRKPPLDNNFNRNETFSSGKVSANKLCNFQEVRDGQERVQEGSALHWRLKGGYLNRSTNNDTEKFVSSSKMRAARYKMMLTDWTKQSLLKRDRMMASAHAPTGSLARRPEQDWVEFYRAHCALHSPPDHKRGEANPDGASSSGAQGSARAVMGSSSMSLAPVPCNIEAQQSADIHAPSSTTQHVVGAPFSTGHHRLRAEVEEEADTEDGLLTAHEQSEIDAAMSQWLSFYGVLQPTTVSRQTSLPPSSEYSMPSTSRLSRLSQDMTSDAAIPQVEAVGEVSQGDLIKARAAWFQFYNILSPVQVWHGSSDRSLDFSLSPARPVHEPNLSGDVRRQQRLSPQNWGLATLSTCDAASEASLGHGAVDNTASLSAGRAMERLTSNGIKEHNHLESQFENHSELRAKPCDPASFMRRLDILPSEPKEARCHTDHCGELGREDRGHAHRIRNEEDCNISNVIFSQVSRKSLSSPCGAADGSEHSADNAKVGKVRRPQKELNTNPSLASCDISNLRTLPEDLAFSSEGPTICVEEKNLNRSKPMVSNKLSRKTQSQPCLAALEQQQECKSQVFVSLVRTNKTPHESLPLELCHVNIQCKDSSVSQGRFSNQDYDLTPTASCAERASQERPAVTSASLKEPAPRPASTTNQSVPFTPRAGLTANQSVPFTPRAGSTTNQSVPFTPRAGLTANQSATSASSPASADESAPPVSPAGFSPRLLLEKLSVRRRALLAELGLYQDFLLGLIPLDWRSLRRYDDGRQRRRGDAESGLSSGQSVGNSASRLEEEAEECPHCLRRSRERQAALGQEIEARLRRLFGTSTPVFSDVLETSALEEVEEYLHTGQVDSETGQRLPGEGPPPEVRMAQDQQTIENSSTACRHVGGVVRADEDCNHNNSVDPLMSGIVGGACDSRQSGPRPAEEHFNHNNSVDEPMSDAVGGAKADVGAEPPSAGEDRNQNNSMDQAVSDPVDGELETPGALPRCVKECDRPGKENGAGQSSAEEPSTYGLGWMWQCMNGISFQALLNGDPTLALVVSLALMLGTQLLCWIPRTLLYVYYDAAGFPAVHSLPEMVTVILWYARLCMTPCVCLYYSRGYRENFQDMLRWPFSLFGLEFDTTCS